MTDKREVMRRGVDAIYARLGIDVEYHHVGGAVSHIKAIDSLSTEYLPSGYDSVVQEERTIYQVKKSDIPTPTKGDFIIDEGVRFDVVGSPEPKDRYEWVMTVKESAS